MESVLASYSSSIAKKVLMSLTGLFLMVFLTEHLIGNLLLFANDNGALYEAYGHFLVVNPVIRMIEILLFLSIAAHAVLGTILWWSNRQTRPVKYRKYRLKDNTPLWSRTTIVTGSVVFLFLVIHLRSFFVPVRLGSEPVSEYELVLQAFANPWYSGFYLIALLLLGYHLRHGFQSAFQTLGLRNKTYTPVIDVVAFVFWFIIPLLYATIPVYFYALQLGGR
jgi:succinate dehydrogenase / fumarate reductase, cytochrome b subunit